MPQQANVKSLRKSERNEQLIADRKTGMTYKTLGGKYGISITRAMQICWKYHKGPKAKERTC